MNKWQKVINQIVKDDEGHVNLNHRQRRISLREAMKQPFYTFERLVDFKNWNKEEAKFIESFFRMIKN
jgi:hypothetical protein